MKLSNHYCLAGILIFLILISLFNTNREGFDLGMDSDSDSNSDSNSNSNSNSNTSNILKALENLRDTGKKSITTSLSKINSKTELLSYLNTLEKQFSQLDTINKSIALLKNASGFESEVSGFFSSSS